METYGTIWKHMETYGNILDNWDRTLDSFSQSFWGLLFTGLRQIFPENQFTKPDITSMIWSYMALLLRDEASKNKQGIWWTYYKRRTSNGKCLGMYGTVWSCHLWGGSMGLLSYSLAIATQKKHHKISQTCLQMEPTVTAARTESMCTLATGLAGGLLQHCSVFYRELV